MHPSQASLRASCKSRTQKQAGFSWGVEVKKQPYVLGPWAGLAVTVSMRVSVRLELRVPVPDICGGRVREASPVSFPQEVSL